MNDNLNRFDNNQKNNQKNGPNNKLCRPGDHGFHEGHGTAGA